MITFDGIVRALTIQGVPRDRAEAAAKAQCGDQGAAVPAPARRGRMNKWEAAYAEHLELLLRGSQILRWDFEPERLRLAKGAYYKPDFRVVLLDGRITFDEVKGYWREAARVRIKVAAELHPMYAFRAVRKGALGSWEFENFSGHLFEPAPRVDVLITELERR